jgi:hypothetical protein
MKSDLSRREFLIGSAGALVAGLGPIRPVAAAPGLRGDLLLGPTLPLELGHGEFGLGVIDVARDRAFSIPTGIEGHSVIARPGRPGHYVLFAQRPGTQCCVVDVEARERLDVFDSGEGRHFYGHGAYSVDGNELLTTENSFSDDRGVIVVRDADTKKAVGEIDAHGDGPHEMYFIDAGRKIVVANGGLKTSPDKLDGYKAYNRESMRSSLAVIETASGKLLERFELENHLLSIRHLSMGPDGHVAMAIQDKEKGSAFSGGPLACVRHPDGRVVELKDEDGLYARMTHHTLSVSLLEETDTVGVTCPYGDLVVFWDLNSGRIRRMVTLPSPSGLALTSDRRFFVVTSQAGGIHQIDANSLELVRSDHEIEPILDMRWGSHLLGFKSQPA